MEELEKIEYPKPHRDFIYDTFNTFAAQHPWVGTENIRPKSIVREMVETYSGFADYIKEYGLERSEGLLLRHLCQVYRALMQTVPSSYYDDEILDMIAFLRTQIAHVDSSLIKEWESLANKDENTGELDHEIPTELMWMQNEKAVHAQIRANLHALVKALSVQKYDEAISWLCHGSVDWDSKHLEASLAPYYSEYETIISDHRARFPGRTLIEKQEDKRYEVRHVLVDPEENFDWVLLGEVNLNRWEHEKPLFQLLEIRS